LHNLHAVINPTAHSNKSAAVCAWRCSCRADEVTLDTVRAEYDTGKSFVSETRDVFGRPVLIITASKHNIGKVELGPHKGWQAT
jgi:hypothetical protein